MYKKRVGTIIKERRREIGINQKELATLSKVSVRKISDIETGKSDTTIGTVEKILEILGMEMVIQVKGISI